MTCRWNSSAVNSLCLCANNEAKSVSIWAMIYMCVCVRRLVSVCNKPTDIKPPVLELRLTELRAVEQSLFIQT